ncbi:MAG: proline--tRNA ligase [Candidatus Gastranaerophilaceae bacterium]
MKMSRLFLETLREFPADAEVISHKLLVRAGYIRKLTHGVYNYLPLMFRVLNKIENIVREEMDKSGAQEILMPFVQPEELWRESGRWDVYGKELMRMKDRHGRNMCLGPTHEEVVTAIAREGIRSYKQLPVNLYQIQSKFRDEIRPRFGLLRGREFIMKDAYSFDVDENGMKKSYEIMAKAYTRIFERCGLETKPVQSDSGAIGGNVSHEYMVITQTDSGENDVFYCDDCDYAANSNHAVSVLPDAQIVGNFEKTEKVPTPNAKTIDELATLLNVPFSLICKCLVYIADKKPVLALIRGDKTVEETKLMNAVGAKEEIRTASEAEIAELMADHGFDARSGFIGPEGFDDVTVVADETVKKLKNFVVAVNENDVHLVGANFGTDVPEPKIYADIRLVEAGEKCPQCGKPLKVTRGIEVGNIFQLGTKYSKAMNATFTDENGKERPFVMGCYGIGISRTAAAAVERFHDEHGIKWPIAIAPYHVTIIPVNTGNELQMKTAEEMYEKLQKAGIDVLIDDRDERAGVKFKDSELIGIPLRITAGKTLEQGLVEYKVRETGEIETLTPDEAVEKVIATVKAALEA